MVPAPHLQRVTSLSRGPPALLLPPSRWGLWVGPARAKNPPLTTMDAWSGTEQDLGSEHLENTRVRARVHEGGLPAASSPAPVPAPPNPASTLLLAHSIFLKPAPESVSPYSFS